MKQNDCSWPDQAAALLTRSLSEIDAETLARLTSARQSALSTAPVKGISLAWWGVASAAVGMLVVGVALSQLSGKNPSLRVDSAERELEMDLTDDNPDFYKDLDFYVWLDVEAADIDG